MIKNKLFNKTFSGLLEIIVSDHILVGCLQHIRLDDVLNLRSTCKRIHSVPLNWYLHNVFESTYTEREKLTTIIVEKFCLNTSVWPVKVLPILLQAQRVDINQIDKDGNTPLCHATINGCTEVVNILILAKANVSSNNKGWSPIIHATTKGYSAIVDILIATNANINEITNNGFSPLMGATCSGHSCIVDKLIKEGADVCLVDNNNWSALTYASKNGHSAIADELISAGADVHTSSKNSGKTALMYALQFGHKQIANNLVSAGADIHRIDNNGWSATQYMMIYGNGLNFS